nr:immunoglobulin light chain junction region [Macaca mulatta]
DYFCQSADDNYNVLF